MTLDFAQIGKDGLVRLKEIAGILVKYGFGELFQNLPFITGTGKKTDKSKLKFSRAARLRMALEELGSTFIKIGQFASIRPDIVSAEYIKELSKLQDEVTAEDFKVIEPVIIKSLGSDWRRLFREFNETPVASASISQVYSAVLSDGIKVAVKVQKPSVKREISSDIRFISLAADFIERKSEWAKMIQLKRIVDEFSVSLKRELDFEREAMLLDRFRQNHKGINEVVIPQPFKNLSSETVLVMSFIEGKPIDECCMDDDEKARIARLLISILVKQVLQDGIFHADPHAGNLLYTPEGKISYLDYGLIGRLGPSMRYHMIDLLQALYSNEPEWIMQEVLALGELDGEVDKNSLIRDVMEVSERYVGVPIKEISTGKALLDLFDIIRRYRIVIHPAYAVVGKAVLTAETIARALDDDINVTEATSAQIKTLVAERYSLKRLGLRLRLLGNDVYRLTSELPGQLREILVKLKSGTLEIEFKHIGLENLIKALDKVSNRLTAGMITAAVIIGSSIIIAVHKEGPLVLGISLFGFVGYLIASILGIGLVIAIIRSGRL
ncbi:MAG: AarF/UbiB family protein [Elusimicrobiota bacterium]